MRTPLKTCVYESYHHTVSSRIQQAFSWVMRAGHLQAGSGYAIRRTNSLGHDLLLCLRGRGSLRCDGQLLNVSSGQLGWIRGSRPHSHAADPATPWELLWLRVDGPGLAAAGEVLGVAQVPVFVLSRPSQMERIFRRILRLLRDQPPMVDALIHAQIAAILALLALTRSAATEEQLAEDPRLAETLTQLRLYPAREWIIADLARIAHMSEPTYFRTFRRLMGTTPMEYLRRLRMNHAMRRLVESSASVKQIAMEVGYHDPLHFSREFHRVVGVSPSVFRAGEWPVAAGSPSAPTSVQHPDRRDARG